MCRILKKFLIVALIAALFLVQGSEGAAALSKGIPDNDTTASTLIVYGNSHSQVSVSCCGFNVCSVFWYKSTKVQC